MLLILIFLVNSMRTKVSVCQNFLISSIAILENILIKYQIFNILPPPPKAFWSE